MPPSWRLKRAETIEQTAHAEPAPPRALNPAVPRDLETICLKCLAKEPARRYATAREVGEEIGRWVEGAPIVARPTPWWERAWLWARRRPAMAGSLAAVALLLGALLLVLVLSSLRIRQAQGETTAKLPDRKLLIGDRDGLSGLTVEADQESRRIRLGRRNQLAAGSGWGRSALSVDGSTFAVARDGHIEVFDARTLQRRAITGDQAGEWVFSVALNRDGSRVAMGGWHGPSVSVWNGGDGKLLRHLSGLSPTVGDTCSVQFAPEDELLVSTGYELLRFPKDLTEARWRVPMREIFCPSILSPNGRVLAVRYRQSLTQLRDAETGLELATLDGANDAHIEELAFDDEGGTLGLLNSRGELWLWNLAGIRHQRAGLKLDWDDTVGLPSEAPTR